MAAAMPIPHALQDNTSTSDHATTSALPVEISTSSLEIASAVPTQPTMTSSMEVVCTRQSPALPINGRRTTFAIMPQLLALLSTPAPALASPVSATSINSMLMAPAL